MPKVTREQVNRWNAKLANGYQIDIFHYVTWGEKNAIKDIKLSDGRKLRVTLEYHDKYDERRRDTGLKQPVVHLSIWTDCANGMMSSHGTGAYMEVGAAQNKKNFNELVKLSTTLQDAEVMVWAKERLSQLNNPFVI